MLTKKDWSVRGRKGGEGDWKEEEGGEGGKGEGRRGKEEKREGEGRDEEEDRERGERGRERERENGGRKIGMPYIIFSLSLKRVTDLQNVPGLLAVKGVHILVALRGPQNLHCYIYSLRG